MRTLKSWLRAGQRPSDWFGVVAVAGCAWIGWTGDTPGSRVGPDAAGAAPELPVVSLQATAPETTEPAPNIRVKPGVFTLTRTGATNEPLRVFLAYSGSATPGLDYVALPAIAEFAPGAASTDLTVAALDDTLVEGLETVAASLTESPFDSLPTYRIDPLHRDAKVAIFDSDQPAPATLELVAPLEGQSFLFGTTITLTARAIDPAGYISRVEFFDRDQRIGVSETTFIRAPDPGEPVVHNLEWKEAQLGAHVITVRARDAAGLEITSEPLQLTVVPADGRPMVSILALSPSVLEPFPPQDKVDTAGFSIIRTGDARDAIQVFFSVSGSATSGVDYKELGSSIRFESGVIGVNLEVVPLADDLVEGTETVVVRLEPEPTVGPGPLPDAYVIDASHQEAKVVILDRQGTDAATLEITSPKNGDTFTFPAKITISATAVDPKSEIREVSFYDGDRLLGVSRILTKDVTIPGRPRVHTFDWAEAPVGSHTLQARAVDSQGNPVKSAPVQVTVVGGRDRVVLGIKAVDPDASESIDAAGNLNVAVFVIERIAGPKDIDVPVFYTVEGSAQNGIDYETLSGSIVLPRDRTAVELVVKPIPDKALEGEETVIIKLEPPVCVDIFPPPPACYLVGAAASARAVIGDTPGAGNVPPVAAIAQPRAGAVFVVGDTIAIHVEATDADGSIQRLDLLADERLLGSTKLGTLDLKWGDATPGPHTLTAVATDNQGSVGRSAPVKILVQKLETVAFVRRDLPPAYVPGEKLKVLLRAEPPPGAKAYAVEDSPPAGWAISDVSDEGAVDTLNGKVKFGPFTDAETRALSYQLTPPAGTLGRHEFNGSGAVDGKSFPIVGDQVIEGVNQLHPADLAPANNRISATELTAYAAAWKEGAAWAEGPTPIPLGYLTRAAALWKGGEAYVFDPAAGEAPLCWRNVEAKAGPPNPGNMALREAPVVLKPGETTTIGISVQPVSGVAAFAVEEVVPPGWKAAGANEGGVINPATGCIRWGPFYGDKPLRLTYSATPPADVTSLGAFAGRASFDGLTQFVGGIAQAAAADASTALRFGKAERLPGKRLRLQLHGRAGQLCVLEASTDLTSWGQSQQTIVGDDGTVVLEDNAADGAARFYRLRVPTTK